MTPKLWIRLVRCVVGEHCLRVEGDRVGVLDGRQEIMSERVAIKQDHKPAHRKPKVSWARLNLPGLVGT